MCQVANLSQNRRRKALEDVKAKVLAFGILSLSVLSGCNSMIGSAQEIDESEPQTRVAIVFDTTRSFWHYMPAALKVVKAFLSRNSVSGEADVYLFRMDSQPRYVKQIPAYELMNDDTKNTIEQLGEPSSELGTDVVGALRLAVEKLRRNENSNQLFLLAFTDGNVDPAKSSERVEQFTSLQDFDWEELKGIRTRFYFLDRKPYNEILSLVANKELDVDAKEAPDALDSRSILQLVEGS